MTRISAAQKLTRSLVPSHSSKQWLCVFDARQLVPGSGEGRKRVRLSKRDRGDGHSPSTGCLDHS